MPLNPKAWALVMTAAAAAPKAWWGLLTNAAAIVLISAGCSTVWAFAGTLLARFLRSSIHLLLFNGVMGLMLVLSAAGLASGLF